MTVIREYRETDKNAVIDLSRQNTLKNILRSFL